MGAASPAPHSGVAGLGFNNRPFPPAVGGGGGGSRSGSFYESLVRVQQSKELHGYNVAQAEAARRIAESQARVAEQTEGADISEANARARKADADAADAWFRAWQAHSQGRIDAATAAHAEQTLPDHIANTQHELGHQQRMRDVDYNTSALDLSEKRGTLDSRVDNINDANRQEITNRSLDTVSHATEVMNEVGGASPAGKAGMRVVAGGGTAWQGAGAAAGYAPKKPKKKKKNKNKNQGKVQQVAPAQPQQPAGTGALAKALGTRARAAAAVQGTTPPANAAKPAANASPAQPTATTSNNVPSANAPVSPDGPGTRQITCGSCGMSGHASNHLICSNHKNHSKVCSDTSNCSHTPPSSPQP